MKKRAGSDYTTILKTILLTAGAIYLVSLATWFFHWATIFAAVAGVGFLAYKAAGALRDDGKERRLLTSESSFESELRRLENEEKLLDSKIGL